MQLHFYSFNSNLILKDHFVQSMRSIMHQLTNGTKTDDLVIAVFLSNRKKHNFGTAYVRQWMHADNFFTKRGKWKLLHTPQVPSTLPPQFKLIRIHININQQYPLIESDIYGWRFSYQTMEDQIAMLFAHELHHYRRHHLGLHPKEGENRANRWALKHVQSLGYRVEGAKIFQKKKHKLINILKHLPHLDPFAAFRHYQAGDTIRIKHDPEKRYCRQDATVVRKLRSNAKRMVIRTQDGKEWRWPVHWLDHKNSVKS